MALAGAHIACGFIGGHQKGAFLALLGQVAWSQTMSAAGTTTNVAPYLDGLVAPSFEFYATIDAYVAWGPNPDPVAGPRIFVPALTTRNIFCNPNDKLAWVAA